MSEGMELKRVSELVSDGARALPRKALEEVMGADLVIERVEIRQGPNSEYAFFVCSSLDGERFTLITGAQAVMEVVKDPNFRTPALGRFERRQSKRGRSYWVLV